ncbi:Peptidase M17, leucyl aminopeptidase, C-terminal [Trema orientale]|uniref:Peptidase M17, leucyl aminopeptidase, C-terminal n=1 Tax=Trema orientale TaxID=63057 RepID=A0A2P5EI05_TREOI|nr:Peptidase M17, leucyl aminopeptidase, C-terminal [Trema orientale]
MPTPTARISTLRNLSSPISKGLLLISPLILLSSDDLAKEVLTASEASGEKLWRLPLEDSYWESVKSGIADMFNTGSRQGGAITITAALFLKQTYW